MRHSATPLCGNSLRLSSYAYLHTPHSAIPFNRSTTNCFLSSGAARGGGGGGEAIVVPISIAVCLLLDSIRAPLLLHLPLPLPVSLVVPLVRCLPTPTITININHIYPKRKCFLLQWRSQKIHRQQGNLAACNTLQIELAECGQLACA